ncbi:MULTISPECIES: fructosamine kinase family protein [Microbacterium]|uniref:fructosamine kinase family protein n=1 Tax=Microbacterium TaxID=33882 RepID=UPI0027870209|nr:MULTISPECIES: fructosamine kinase family protein [Microbacterium]MDQ1083487.1 fructosamine-3-kinase [Microbacterium sp. SORGH_AS_0344]MDQ1171234.1 fructosamine-3-kinase [Microbacterium proteolyticum]
MEQHVKTRSDAPAGFFAAEAAGLSWLAEARGARIARVVEVVEGRITLERVGEARPTADAARAFGAALATTHAAGADAFGSPPPGWRGDIFIGRRSQPARPTPTWGAFYAAQRVEPFLAVAVAAGNLSASGAALVRRACALIADGAFDDDESPARLHGDLWAGNVLWSNEGVVLIDPAAHGGHRETDLAMLALFGCPFLEEIVASYDAAHPLREGWRARVPLHQLHPLAVHAAGHGPSYGRALVSAAERTLALR